MPKFNMYQSLHTTVIGPEGKPVELQIRTYAMHRTAEYGIAAHWKYKEQKGADLTGPMAQDDMLWLRQLLDWQRETQEPGEFLDTLRFDLSTREVYVFTPKGDVIALPGDSTPVDFAYAIHTDVGHRCIGARVNRKLVALESTLENGDTVEIITAKSETAGPSQDWLLFVKSPRAKNKIKQWFAKERREDAVDAGKEAISKAVRKQGLPLQRLLGGEAMVTMAKDMRYPDVSTLYAAIGENQISAQTVVHRLMAALGGPEGAVEDIAETTTPTRTPHRRVTPDAGVVVAGASDVWVKLAKCCTPVPGDDILGFVMHGGGVSVHRRACINAASLVQQAEHLVDVTWQPSTNSVFLAAIHVEAFDHQEVFAKVTAVITREQVRIVSGSLSACGGVAICYFILELAEPRHLGHLLRTLQNTDEVYDAYRVLNAHEDHSTSTEGRTSELDRP
jgi:GTP pyrophosphokinase